MQAPHRGRTVRVFGRNLLNGLTITTLDGGTVILTKNPDGGLYPDIYESSEASASFTVEVVVKIGWLPPVINSDPFMLQDGTSLPLSFQALAEDGSAIADPLDVCLVVTGPGLNGAGHRFHLGEGRGFLNFEPGDASHTGVFHPQDFDLEDGGIFRAGVYGPGDLALFPTVDFTLSTEKGTGRGKGPQ